MIYVCERCCKRMPRFLGGIAIGLPFDEIYNYVFSQVLEKEKEGLQKDMRTFERLLEYARPALSGRPAFVPEESRESLCLFPF